MRPSCSALLAILLATGIGSATAQPASGENSHEGEGQSQETTVTTPEYDSAFSDYRWFDSTPEMIDWRGANDEVGRLGGFMGHMQNPPAWARPPGETAR